MGKMMRLKTDESTVFVCNLRAVKLSPVTVHGPLSTTVSVLGIVRAVFQAGVVYEHGDACVIQCLAEVESERKNRLVHLTGCVSGDLLKAKYLGEFSRFKVDEKDHVCVTHLLSAPSVIKGVPLKYLANAVKTPVVKELRNTGSAESDGVFTEFSPVRSYFEGFDGTVPVREIKSPWLRSTQSDRKGVAPMGVRFLPSGQFPVSLSNNIILQVAEATDLQEVNNAYY
jgi:hypothetical protein